MWFIPHHIAIVIVFSHRKKVTHPEAATRPESLDTPQPPMPQRSSQNTEAKKPFIVRT